MKTDNHFDFIFSCLILKIPIKLLLTMDFPNTLANNEEELQNEYFYYDEDDSAE